MNVEINCYNPKTHKGNLPVRVLQHNIICCFEAITPEFLKEAEGEVLYNNLKAGIIYNIDKKVISDAARIVKHKNENNEDYYEIELFENFNQYLWCICYALLVVFDEGIQKPIHANTYNGQIDFSNHIIKNAFDIFENGLDLFQKYKSQEFYNLPNPEKYCCSNNYIEKTNGIYCTAMTFILLHEFAHQYYGHVTYTPDNDKQSKKEEFAADDFAIDKFLKNAENKYYNTLRIGLIAGISALILLNKSLSGGNTHPDTDDRLDNALNKLQIDDDDYLWYIASITYILWTKKYNIELCLNQYYNTYKECYDDVKTKIKNVKQ